MEQKIIAPLYKIKAALTGSFFLCTLYHCYTSVFKQVWLRRLLINLTIVATSFCRLQDHPAVA